MCHIFPFPALQLGSEMQIPSMGDIWAVAPQEGHKEFFTTKWREKLSKNHSIKPNFSHAVI